MARRVTARLVSVNNHPDDGLPWSITYWRRLPDGTRQSRIRQHYRSGKATLDLSESEWMRPGMRTNG